MAKTKEGELLEHCPAFQLFEPSPPNRYEIPLEIEGFRGNARFLGFKHYANTITPALDGIFPPEEIDRVLAQFSDVTNKLDLEGRLNIHI